MSRKTIPERNAQDQKYLLQIGNNIREARKRKGISQEEFADLADFSRSYYTEIETGRRNVSILNLIKIIETLDVDAGTIIGPLKKRS